MMRLTGRVAGALRLAEAPGERCVFCDARRLADGPGLPPCGARRPPIRVVILDSAKTDLGRISFLWLNGESGLFARRG
jgi:hypothetical protein